MENWSMSKLKAHLQFELGRVDSLRWSLDRIELFHHEDNSEYKQRVEERVRDIEATARDCEQMIQAILDEREAKKQEEKDRKAELHDKFTKEML